MKLSPPQPYNNGSNAELLIFDAFRKIEMPDAICFNSLHLVSHRDKRMSEIDFVLICNRGIFVFEVKGGRVFQNRGKWYSRSKQKNHAIENPFNQSRRALFSLLDSLKQQGIVSSKVPTGYGVLLPNTLGLEDSIEYDSSMFGSKGCLKGFASWLDSFIQYWVSKSDSLDSLNHSQVTAIANYLRPDSVLNEKVTRKSFEHLNSMQQQVVTAFEHDKRIICEGAAGTGKTHLIELIAQECVHPGEKLLILCESKWLKGKLKAKLNSFNTVVATIESLQIESRRAFITQYDVVIVDEAQDLYHSPKIDLLEGYIKGGFSEGKWALFQDLTNQSDFFTQPDDLIIERLKNSCDVYLALDTAYRYSRVTLNYLSDLLGSDRIHTKKIHGPNVEIFSPESKQDEKKRLEKVISKAINAGYSYSDITVLSASTFFESTVANLPASTLKNVIQVDDFNVKSFPLGGISFSELNHFKGLENKVIILIDFSEECLNNTSKAYVALTRASERLFIVWACSAHVMVPEPKPSIETEILDIVPDSSRLNAWNEVLELTILLEECKYLIERFMLPPICGYELVVEERVISEVELAWPRFKLCIFGDDAELKDIEIFSKAGWICYQAPLSTIEFDEIISTSAK